VQQTLPHIGPIGPYRNSALVAQDAGWVEGTVAVTVASFGVGSWVEAAAGVARVGEATNAAVKVGETISATTGVADGGLRVLDVGGGSFSGMTTKSIVRTPEGVVSINPNAAHGPTVVGRAQNLPFADASFDRVTMNHFPADQFEGGTLSEVARVLGPGGQVSITKGKIADVSAITSELNRLGFSTTVGTAENGIPWIIGGRS